MQFTCHSIALSHSETKYFPVKLQMNLKKKERKKKKNIIKTKQKILLGIVMGRFWIYV